MPRYIDAELLESKYREGTDPQDPYSEITYLLPEDVESIPTADVEPVKGWISVKERLPEYDYLYIVCRTIQGHQICFEARWEGNKWLSVVENVQLGYITHWQPLPEPPKENGWVDDESLPNEDMIPDNELIGGW